MTAVSDESLEKALAKVDGDMLGIWPEIRDDWYLSSQHSQSHLRCPIPTNSLNGYNERSSNLYVHQNLLMMRCV
jgi:hypothetical protein